MHGFEEKITGENSLSDEIKSKSHLDDIRQNYFVLHDVVGIVCT